MLFCHMKHIKKYDLFHIVRKKFFPAIQKTFANTYFCQAFLLLSNLPKELLFSFLKIFNNVFDVHITIDLKRQEKTGLTSTCCQIKI